VEFRILGPIEVRDGERVLPLGAGQQRALLALLLLRANETLSRDRLIHELWGERPPSTAAKALQGHVSALRKLLERERVRGDPGRVIVTRGSGYELRLESEQLDLAVFERLRGEGMEALARAEPERAAARLREALALWRGPALAELAFEPFAQAEIARLEELRMATLEDRLEADLASGRDGELVGELEVLVRRYPLRERLRAQLMLALYRAGRQADALQVYQATRRTLVEELGIEPSRPLQELERAILTQDPSLEPSKATATPAASERPEGSAPGSPFVGRERELAELTAALDDALAARGRLVLLAGEPGIGKSRLAEEVANRAKERGARVLVGRCWEAGGAPAYWPWMQALRPYLRETESAALREQLGAGARDVAQILPELRELFPDLPAPPSLEPEAARFRLFESIATFLTSAAAARPLVIVFDDLHAADEPTLLLLRFVTRQLGAGRVLVVGAYRDVDPTVADSLATALTELARERVTRTVALGGLDEANVARLIELTAGEAPHQEIVGTIHEETEGNPLFVGEIVRLLLAERRLDASVGGKLAIPQSVKDVIGRRLRHLSAECNRVLTLASVLGHEFDVAALANVSGVDRDTLLELLDEAIGARVVSEVPGATGRLRFAHALIRDTAYEALTRIRRARLHRLAGEALEDLHGDDPDPYLAELAHHFFEGASDGDSAKAVAYARRAGDRAVVLVAYEEAVRLHEMALSLTETGSVARCEVLLALGDAQARAGDTPSSKRSFREAADLADALGLTEHLAHAALGYGGRIIWEVSRDDTHLAQLLERSLAILGDEDNVLRVRLLARLAGGPLRDSSFARERRAALSGEALEVARRIGDPTTLAYALQGYVVSHHSPDFTPQQRELAAETIRVAMEAGDKERAFEGHENRLYAVLELGEVDEAKLELEAMARLVDELRQPAHEWVVRVSRALLALLEGRLAEAEGLIEETRLLGERVLSWSAAVSYGLQLYALRWEQGRLEEVEGVVRRSVEEYPTYPVWRCVAAHMATALGRAADARDAFESLAADDFAVLPFDEEWLVSMSLLAETATFLRDSQRAAILYERLAPYADRVAISYPEIALGSVSRYLGLLATTMDRFDEAERHLEDALARNQRIGARPWFAHTQGDYARMLLARDGVGDREHAQKLVDEALVTYRDLGMDAYAARVSALAEQVDATA
jgi:DNA-binding SARP family transcriptional activator/tetratricopeptide (TPR) repeat protein